MKQISLFFTMVCLTLISARPVEPEKGELTITVTDIRSNKGYLMVSIYNDGEGFPSDADKAMLTRRYDVSGDSYTCSFTNIPYGEYAVAIFHDENGNGEMDTNFIGIPKEGVGVSNDAIRTMGPPRYEDAKFSLNRQKVSVRVPTHYM